MFQEGALILYWPLAFHKSGCENIKKIEKISLMTQIVKIEIQFS